MKKLCFALILMVSFTASAKAQPYNPNVRVLPQYYSAGYGWYTPGVSRVSGYNWQAYQYYGDGNFGNNYYGPTPFQRSLGVNYYGQTPFRIQVGPYPRR